MSKNERNGQRKLRHSTRQLRLGYYYIVTDTEATEKNYLEGLRDSLPKDKQKQIKIKVIKSPACNFVKKCKEFSSSESQYGEPWIIFDRDEETLFDKIISEAHEHNISVGWSNPCIEIWFLAYFGKMTTHDNSQKCITEFARLFQKKLVKHMIRLIRNYTINYLKLATKNELSNFHKISKTCTIRIVHFSPLKDFLLPLSIS